MAAPVSENEFMQYWSKLTTAEKELLLTVARQYVQLKSEDADGLRKQLVMEERASYLKGEGRSFSWEEVKDMAASKEKRNDTQPFSHENLFCSEFVKCETLY